MQALQFGTVLNDLVVRKSNDEEIYFKKLNNNNATGSKYDPLSSPSPLMVSHFKLGNWMVENK